MNLPWSIEERTNVVPDNTTRTFVDYTTIRVIDSRGRTVATLGTSPNIDSPYLLSLAECREAARAMVGAVNAMEVVA